MKSDMEKIFESYLNQSAISYDQQRSTDNRKFSPVNSNVSNYQQFSGLTGNGQMNSAQVPSFDAFGDEEEKLVAIKGYGKVSIPQLKNLIKDQYEKIGNYINNDTYGIDNQVELLKLFCKTMEENK